MRTEETKQEYSLTFDSLEDIADVAVKHANAYLDGGGWGDFEADWHGVDSAAEARRLAVEGWDAEAGKALAVAEAAIESVEREHTVATFHPVWDVAGCEVDVARYLANEPENMIDYEIVPTTRVGRVITLCASVSYSGAVSTETIRKRGHAIAALALALNQLGYQTELWADLSSKGTGGHITRIRSLVKGANDELDPGKVMFAYSHPAMLRAIGMPTMHELPERLHKTVGIGCGYGCPSDPKQDLPEGTIYMPSVLSPRDVPEARDELLRYMRELGIITD